MDSTPFIDILHRVSGNVAVGILAISIAICLFRRNKLTPPFQRLLLFLFWNFCIEIAARIFANFKINNLPLLHLYTLGEFLLLSYFYQRLLTKPRFLTKNFMVIMIIGGLAIAGNSAFLQSIFEFNSIAKTIVQLWIIGLAVAFFYHLMAHQSDSEETQLSLRLVNSAILIYYSGSLFIFMASQLYMEQAVLFKYFWIFNAILNMIFQLLILWAICKVVFRKTTSFS